MEEIWKDIPGYEGYYQVSNIGRVRSLDRVKRDGIKMKGVIRKPHIDACGYHLVALIKDCKVKNTGIHRLVAMAFIPNPDNLPQVNHIDEVRSHNSVDNLEWCSVAYNQNYGHRKERSSEKLKGERNGRAILTENDVRAIRKTYIPDDNEYGVRALSNKYGVKCITIQKILAGKLWKHILEEN